MDDKCTLCGQPMNPVEVMLAGRYGTCGACVKRLHAQVTGKRQGTLNGKPSKRQGVMG